MQPIEEFFREYFQERTALQRSLALLYEPLAARFLAATYRSFNSRKSVEDSEAERILSVKHAGATAEAITRGWLGAEHRVRYRLSAEGDSWRITSIEIECGICQGTGKRDRGECRPCKGKGWNLIGENRET